MRVHARPGIESIPEEQVQVKARRVDLAREVEEVWGKARESQMALWWRVDRGQEGAQTRLLAERQVHDPCHYHRNRRRFRDQSHRDLALIA